MSIIFLACIFISFANVIAIWYQQIVIIPLFKNLRVHQIDAFYKSYKNNILLFTLPLHTLEAFTTFISLIFFVLQPDLTSKDETSFYILGASLFLLGIIHAITFLSIKLGIRKLQSENATLNDYQQFHLWNFARAILWTIRLVLIFSILF